MRQAATTFISIAFLVLTAALPSRAAEPERERSAPVVDDTSPTAHLVVGLFATTVQLSVYGGCLAFGGEHSACVESADVASRRAAGRSAAL